MFLRGVSQKYYAPAGEEGSEQVDDQILEQGSGEGEAEGAGAEPQSLRQQLEKSFEAERKATTEKDEKSRNKKSGYTSRARQEAAADAGAEEQVEQQGEQQQQPETKPPEAFAKEAKAEWAKVPPTVQAAILKREEDVVKGVQELKQRYTDLDQAIAPFADQIRAGGKSPAQAVQQLFAWFNALANNPKEAFPALAQSFGYSFGQQAPQEQQQAPVAGQEQQPPGEVPPAVQQYITTIEQKLEQLNQAFSQKLQGVEQTFAAQNQAKTNEILTNWSKDKPHYSEVRQTMARLIQSGEVPLNNGQVDLDKAYEVAIWAVPDVRAKVIAEQREAEAAAAKSAQDAERKAQQQQAEKAKKTATSVAGGAPGAPGVQQPKKGKGKSVRESIMEAREQLT